jgi:hypothetical protein
MGSRDISNIPPRHVLPKLVTYVKHCRQTGKPFAALLQSISGVSAINPLVAFYHGGKREVLFFYSVPDTTRDRTTNDKEKTNI